MERGAIIEAGQHQANNSNSLGFIRGSLRARLLMGIIAAGFVSGCGCMDFLNPAPFRQKLEDERNASIKPVPKLNADGTLPAKAADAAPATSATEGSAANPATTAATGASTAAPQAAAPADISPKFEQLCSSCHGKEGKGDGAAATALNPKPRNFTDKAWQGKVDDARIAKVIKEGGASVGLSPLMAPWGAMLNEAEITALVAKVRSFGK